MIINTMLRYLKILYLGLVSRSIENYGEVQVGYIGPLKPFIAKPGFLLRHPVCVNIVPGIFTSLGLGILAKFM